LFPSLALRRLNKVYSNLFLSSFNDFFSFSHFFFYSRSKFTSILIFRNSTQQVLTFFLQLCHILLHHTLISAIHEAFWYLPTSWCISVNDILFFRQSLKQICLLNFLLNARIVAIIIHAPQRR
jgi:hypothetical protein